jgi:hypothetical protein
MGAKVRPFIEKFKKNLTSKSVHQTLFFRHFNVKSVILGLKVVWEFIFCTNSKFKNIFIVLNQPLCIEKRGEEISRRL